MSLTEHAKRAVLSALVQIRHNPRHAVLLEGLQWRHCGQLEPIAAHYGIALETLAHQRDQGLDNPAYRFARDAGLFDYLHAHREALHGASWLDVGAGTGALSVYLSEMLVSSAFTLCDVITPARANAPVRRIDGNGLDYADKSHDLVFFNYVLHHAADHTIALLNDARRIARRYVIITEDPKERVADCVWAYAHDRRATFRGLCEWRALFALMGFRLVYELPLQSRVHSRHLFVLASANSEPQNTAVG